MSSVKNAYEYKTTISVSLPISYIQKVEDFRKRYRLKSRTDAFQQLLDLSFHVESKIGLVESISSDEMEIIKEQIEKGQIVDYFEQMDSKKFSLLVNIIQDEQKARNKRK